MAKILVVDDSSSVRNGVADYLRSQNLDVVTAIDGIDAFDQLFADDDIALALVDVNMPNMDGMTFIQKVHLEIPESTVVFIMLTTEFSDELKALGKKIGVKGWIIKPFKGEQAIGTIQRMLLQSK